jgi:hypothetical protein
MKYVIKSFDIEDDKMNVGFDVYFEDLDHHLYHDERVPLVEGKTDEEYVSEAFASAKSFFDEVYAGLKRSGREWNPDTGTFV